MLKSTVIAILIAASSVLPSGALTGKGLGERAQTDERGNQVNG